MKLKARYMGKDYNTVLGENAGDNALFCVYLGSLGARTTNIILAKAVLALVSLETEKQIGAALLVVHYLD
jgi:hypothetical protein